MKFIIIFVIIFLSSETSSHTIDSINTKCLETRVYCMSLPESCVQLNTSCNILLTATAVTDNGSVEFELFGRVDDSTRWFAMALSLDQYMGNDSVTEIFISNDGKQTGMRQSWNEVGSNQVVGRVDGITQIGSITYSNGLLYGKWQRNAITNIKGNTFNILQNKFYILLAQGVLDQENTKLYHSQTSISNAEIDLQSTPKDALTELYKNCNKTEMLCFGLTDGCIESKNCELIVGITSGGYGLTNGTVEFELIGKSGEGKDIDQWIAMGLSDDDKMGNDSVVECLVFKNGTTKFRNSWNYLSGGHKANEVINNAKGFISFGNVSYDNGLISCKWSQLPYSKVKDVTYDLIDNNYYILLAKGKLADEKTGRKDYHNGKRFVSKTSFNLQSDASGPNSTTTEKSITSTAIPSTISQAYERCFNNERLCFGLPAKCIDSKGCKVLFSSVSVSKQTGDVEIELFWKHDMSSDNRWAAAALSSDQLMGSDSVTECILNDNRNITIREGWNPPNHEPTQNVDTKDSAIIALNSSDINGILYCKWSRRGMTSVKGNTFDILNDKYYLLLAFGPMRSEDIIGKHEDKIISSDKIDLQSVGVVTASGVSILIKLHGTFMIIAWLGCVSIAIIMARHYKSAWPETTICGVKIWFAIHRSLMVISVILIIVASIMILLYRKGWTGASAHPILGVIAISLSILQPIGALFRPNPNSSKRWIFNWTHWFAGNIAHIVSFTTILLASNFPNVLPKQFVWIMVSFAIYYIISHLVHHLHSYIANLKSGDYDLEEDLMNKHNKENLFANIRVVFNSVIITGFVITLIYLIYI